MWSQQVNRFIYRPVLCHRQYSKTANKVYLYNYKYKKCCTVFIKVMVYRFDIKPRCIMFLFHNFVRLSSFSLTYWKFSMTLFVSHSCWLSSQLRLWLQVHPITLNRSQQVQISMNRPLCDLKIAMILMCLHVFQSNVDFHDLLMLKLQK